MRKKKAGILIVAVLIFSLVFPQPIFAQWVVYDPSAFFQRLFHYIDEGLQFAEEMVQIYEEVKLMTDQLSDMDSIKDFTDDFMDLYSFSLETLDSPAFQRIFHADSSYSYDSPPTARMTEDLAGKEAGDYQKYMDASKHLENINELRELFSQIYWNLDAIKHELELVYKDESEEKERMRREIKRLGVIEAKKIGADAAVARVNEFLKDFNDKKLKSYDNTLRNAADNPTKIAQVQAAGIGNLQKLNEQQITLQAKSVTLLSELLAEEGLKRKAADKFKLQQKKISGEEGRTKKEYERKVKKTVDDFAKALFHPSSGEK